MGKLANVMGRGQLYVVAVTFYVISYVLMATARSFTSYSAGFMFYSIGQSGTDLLNDVIVADITNVRWRALYMGLIKWPYLITPWISGFMISAFTGSRGLGWRWGIGILAILMPICTSMLIATLLHYHRKAQKQELISAKVMPLSEFCSEVDLGGLIIVTMGFALILLPLNLTTTDSSRWNTSWIGGLIGVGVILLVMLPFYEHFVAKNPVIPPHYFTDRTIAMAMFITITDQIGYAVTQRYMLSWSTVAKGLSTSDTTLYTFIYTLSQSLSSILVGWLVGKTRRYKWMVVLGAVVRLAGYGMLVSLPGPQSKNVGEIFGLQALLGVGGGMLAATVVVPAQAVVPRVQMPQVTALIFCFAILGFSTGACIASGIYDRLLEPALLNYLGDGATDATVTKLVAAITAGTALYQPALEKAAISNAVSIIISIVSICSAIWEATREVWP